MTRSERESQGLRNTATQKDRETDRHKTRDRDVKNKDKEKRKQKKDRITSKGKKILFSFFEKNL